MMGVEKSHVECSKLNYELCLLTSIVYLDRLATTLSVLGPGRGWSDLPPGYVRWVSRLGIQYPLLGLDGVDHPQRALVSHAVGALVDSGSVVSNLY